MSARAALPDWRDVAARVLTVAGVIGLNGFAVGAAWLALWTLSNGWSLVVVILAAAGSVVLVGLVGLVLGIDFLICGFIGAGLAEQLVAEIEE